MTIVLIILFVLILLNTVSFLVERARTHRTIRQLKSTCYELNESIRRMQKRLEAVIEKHTESTDYLSNQYKLLKQTVEVIEISLSNLHVCPAAPEEAPAPEEADKPSTAKKRHTYSEADKEQAVAWYEQHKSEGVSKTQAAKALGIPVSTYKSWF